MWNIFPFGRGVLPSGGSFFLPVVVLVMLAGCAPQLDRIEVSVQENRDEISRLQTENMKLLQEVQALGQLLRMDRDAGDESSAMRLAKLTMVSTRLDQLMQKLDDNAEYMRALSARVDLLATRSGIPTLGEYKPPAASSVAAETLPEEGRAIFEMAELDRNRGNVELAKSGYQEFLLKYGNSELSDDALFKLGVISYGEGDNSTALDYFMDMLERFPASELAPAALYKGRVCLLNLGRGEEAVAMGETLVNTYPSSNEAALLQAENEE